MKNVSLHYDYALVGQKVTSANNDERSLQQFEIDAFQRWLDEDERGISIPLVEGELETADLRVANELITHYCRYRHNDWSAEWIRKHLAAERLGTFANWVEDLILLCRSHHQGRDELAKKSFDPRPVGSPPSV